MNWKFTATDFKIMRELNLRLEAFLWLRYYVEKAKNTPFKFSKKEKDALVKAVVKSIREDN